MMVRTRFERFPWHRQIYEEKRRRYLAAKRGQEVKHNSNASRAGRSGQPQLDPDGGMTSSFIKPHVDTHGVHGGGHSSSELTFPVSQQHSHPSRQGHYTNRGIMIRPPVKEDTSSRDDVEHGRVEHRPEMIPSTSGAHGDNTEEVCFAEGGQDSKSNHSDAQTLVQYKHEGQLVPTGQRTEPGKDLVQRQMMPAPVVVGSLGPEHGPKEASSTVGRKAGEAPSDPSAKRHDNQNGNPEVSRKIDINDDLLRRARRSKAEYGQQLRDQMEHDRARRIADREQRKISQEGGTTMTPTAPTAPTTSWMGEGANTPRRKVENVSSKADYAMQLREQMAATEAARRAEKHGVRGGPLTTDGRGRLSNIELDEEGRCRNGPKADFPAQRTPDFKQGSEMEQHDRPNRIPRGESVALSRVSDFTSPRRSGEEWTSLKMTGAATHQHQQMMSWKQDSDRKAYVLGAEEQRGMRRAMPDSRAAHEQQLTTER